MCTATVNNYDHLLQSLLHPHIAGANNTQMHNHGILFICKMQPLALCPSLLDLLHNVIMCNHKHLVRVMCQFQYTHHPFTLKKRNLALPSSISSSSHLHSILPCIHAMVMGLQQEYQPRQNQYFSSIRLYHVPIQGHHRVGLERRRGDFELLGDGAGDFLHSGFFFEGIFWWQGSWCKLWRHDVVLVAVIGGVVLIVLVFVVVIFVVFNVFVVGVFIVVLFVVVVVVVVQDKIYKKQTNPTRRTCQKKKKTLQGSHFGARVLLRSRESQRVFASLW